MEDWNLTIARGETTHVDFKAPMGWDATSRASLAEDIVGMTNTRGGGALLIGVSEGDDGGPRVDGVTPGQSGSFDPTQLTDFVAGYFQPAVRLRVERPMVDGKSLVAIIVAEFETTPVICTKDGPKRPDGKRLFYAGDLLIRTAAAKTVKICTAEDMHALVRLAVIKMSDALLEDVRKIVEGVPDRREARQEPHVGEMQMWTEKLEEKTKAWRTTWPRHGWFSMSVLPRAPLATPLDQAAMRRLVQQAQASGGGLRVPSAHEDKFTRIQNRPLAVEGTLDLEDYQEVWQLHCSGAFMYARMLHYEDRDGRRMLPFEEVIFLLGLGLAFAQRLYADLMPDGEVEVVFGVHEVKDQLLGSWNRIYRLDRDYRTVEDSIQVSEPISVLDLRSARRHAVDRFAKKIFNLFNFEISSVAVEQQLDNLEGKR